MSESKIEKSKATGNYIFKERRLVLDKEVGEYIENLEEYPQLLIKMLKERKTALEIVQSMEQLFIKHRDAL